MCEDVKITMKKRKRHLSVGWFEKKRADFFVVSLKKVASSSRSGCVKRAGMKNGGVYRAGESETLISHPGASLREQ